MLIAIFGENCTGKSTLAGRLKEELDAEIYTGKDYLRLAKDEASAQKLFRERLRDAVAGNSLIYVISEKEHLSLVPDGAVRVLVTAELSEIKERFAARMHGQLPPPVAAMLERKHGCFDSEPCGCHLISGQTDVDGLCAQILSMSE